MYEFLVLCIRFCCQKYSAGVPMCFKATINNAKPDVARPYWHLVCLVMRYRLELYKNIQIYVIDESRYLMLKNRTIDTNFSKKIVLSLVIFYAHALLLFIHLSITQVHVHKNIFHIKKIDPFKDCQRHSEINTDKNFHQGL